MNLEGNAIVLRLVSEFGYTQKRAEEAVQKLQTCSPLVQEAFEQWWQGEGLDEHLIVQGYTLQWLVDKRGFKPMGAFLTMDWIIREPDKAVRALAKGYDRVVISPEMKLTYHQISEDFKIPEKEKEQDI